MATATAMGDRMSGASERGLGLALRVIRVGPALILLLLVVILALASPFFLTGDNISNVAVQVSPLACLAIGQLFVILVGGIDLSVGSLLALCTVTGALAYGWGDVGGPLVIPVMLLTGAAALAAIGFGGKASEAVPVILPGIAITLLIAPIALRAPFSTAESELATAIPRSSWQ